MKRVKSLVIKLQFIYKYKEHIKWNYQNNPISVIVSH